MLLLALKCELSHGTQKLGLRHLTTLRAWIHFKNTFKILPWNIFKMYLNHSQFGVFLGHSILPGFMHKACFCVIQLVFSIVLGGAVLFAESFRVGHTSNTCTTLWQGWVLPFLKPFNIEGIRWNLLLWWLTTYHTESTLTFMWSWVSICTVNENARSIVSVATKIF